MLTRKVVWEGLKVDEINEAVTSGKRVTILFI